MESNPIVSLFLAIALIILASRIGGSIARRFGQPRVLGELIIGVILGPTVLDMLHWQIFHGIELEEAIREFAELGVVLLMFIVGLEVNIKELSRVGSTGVISGILGAMVPVGVTYLVMTVFNYDWQPALFAGVTLAATSVSISAQVLFELNFLRTKVGSALLATALIDDVLAILLVSITIAFVGTGESATSGTIVAIILQMIVYLVVAFLISWFLIPHLMHWVSTRPFLSQSYGIPAIAFILVLIFAWSAEEFGGVAMITGSFIAGIGLGKTDHDVKHQIEEVINGIAFAFLVPIFFVDVGLSTDLSTFPIGALPLAITLLTIGIASKVIGCGFGAKVTGFTNHESLQLGVCMISRGEVGLIIASLGISTGVFTQSSPLFASLFMVILLTTLVTPILVRIVFPKQEKIAPLKGVTT